MRVHGLHCVEDQVLLRYVFVLHHALIAFLKVINADSDPRLHRPQRIARLSPQSPSGSAPRKMPSPPISAVRPEDPSTRPLTFSIIRFRSTSEARSALDASTTSSTESVGLRRRSASIARFRAITASHAPSDPRPDTNASGLRQTWKKISCITSSACPGSFSTRSATEYTMPPYRSKSSVIACLVAALRTRQKQLIARGTILRAAMKLQSLSMER